MKRDGFVPRYKAVFEELAKRIRSGQYASGEKLPFERELCGEFGVERVTVRHALELLSDEGLIAKRPGVGSFVKGDDAASGRSRTIVFAMHRNQNDIRHNANAFNSMLFFLAEQACQERGCTLLYTSVQDADTRISALEGPAVAGALLISRHSAAVLDSAIDSGVPIVCVNHRDPRAMSILPDNVGGVRAAIARLAAWGHTRIGFIGGMPGMVNASERLSGFRYGLWDSGLEYRPELIAPGDWTYDSGCEAMRALLRAGEPPTAVFAASDMMGLGAVAAARDEGLRVPEDISVIGFDNIDMGAYCTPGLTTVGVDARQIAQLAVESILRFAEKPPRDFDRYVVRVPASLISRASAGPRR